MNHILAIALGGAVGAVSRHIINFQIASRLGTSFPWGILVVNGLGCFFMGLVVSYAAARELNQSLQLLLNVGFLGALTTFSAYSSDTFSLLKSGKLLFAVMNAGGSIILGLFLLWLGLFLGRSFFYS